ncbi:MAG: type II secretion system secretin GspD, partial [Deltaproteobacteria bacterium]|nr:type II secretion system secretin GspD [Deltaproteobacteria bacterium]
MNINIIISLIVALVIFQGFSPLPDATAARMTKEAKIPDAETSGQSGATDASAASKGSAGKQDSMITMDFNNVDIRLLVKFISKITGKNFVLDNNVKGEVTIVSPTKITVDEAYRVFLSVLEVNGFTTLPAGGATKIVAAREAREKDVEIRTRDQGRAGEEDRMITQIIPLKHTDAEEIKNRLASLISRNSSILSYPPTNTVIVTDYASNIRRILGIIKEIDVAGFEYVLTVIHLKHGESKDIAKEVKEVAERGIKSAGSVFRGATPAGQTTSVRVIADERTNSVIIMAPPQDTQSLKDLVESLDAKTPRGRSNIHVFYLKNAVAEDIAKVIADLPGKGEDPKKAKPPVISKDVKVTPDKATNSLVITATPEEYATLSEVIGKLDIPRSMVYVECLIVEVSTDKNLQLGVEWLVGNEYNAGGGKGYWFGGSTAGSTGAMGSLLGNLESTTPSFQAPAGFALGVLGKTITYGGVTFPSLGALVQANQSDTDFNVLSTPQILTTDNEEATIKVAQNIPFTTRVDQGTATTDRAIQSFDYKDVGITLKVTPHITKDMMVRLAVEEEVKNVINATVTGKSGDVLLAPSTNVRTAKTTVIVPDKYTVVIGGLISDRSSKTISKAPCVGDVPALGWLFKTGTGESIKENLMVFLTPHIIESSAEAMALYERKR